jgi:hypothetical protein
MNSLFKLLSIAAVVSFALLIGGPGSAYAQMSKDDQKCVDKANNGLGKLGKTQAKEDRTCVKNATKGKESDPEGCLSRDDKGKVAKAKSKIAGCPTAAIPIDKTTAEDAMVAEALELAHDLFGSDLNLVGLGSVSKDDGKCADSIIKGAGAILAEKAKTFRKCKKDGMKAGTIVDPASLQTACLPESGIPDPKGKIAKRITKLGDAITKKCPGGGSSVFDLGSCAGLTGTALRDCADAWAECRICNALNAADGLSTDCNAFSGVQCGGYPPVDIGAHKCTIDSPASEIVIVTQALPLPPFQPVGSVDIDCGTTTPDGKAPCTCTLQDLEPIEIVGIGFVCFTPGSQGCAVGEIDCDGGNALDVTMDSDHNIGACTGNPDCAAQCAAVCAPDGVFNSGCEGFCDGGARDGLPCTNDSACPGGSCPGGDTLPHGNICGCDCLRIGGAPGSAGALQCNMDTNINVELAGPCDGADILIAVGERCIPLTSEALSSQIQNTNNSPGKVFPDPAATNAGVAIDCLDLATSATTGLRLVGTVNFFDSTIGDLNTMQAFTCQ